PRHHRPPLRLAAGDGAASGAGRLAAGRGARRLPPPHRPLQGDRDRPGHGPPLSLEEAAAVAAAALADTLDAVAVCSAPRRIVALHGAPGPWLPAGFEVIPQRGGGLDERLANAWTDP